MNYCRRNTDHDPLTKKGGSASSSSSLVAEGSTGLRSFVEGRQDGPTIVFVHGWPDDHTLWDDQVAHLKYRFRCVTTDLPGFSKDAADGDKWGYGLDEVVRRLEKTVEAAGGGQPVFIISHDWGCLYSFILEKKRPDLVRKMVAIDVGGAIEFKPLQLLCIMSYHFWLIIAFVVGGPIGDAMAQSFAWLVGAPFRSNVAKASVCYPYYHWWKQKLCRGPKVGAMVPEVPLLFLYGTSGPKAAVPFHASWWAEEVDRKEGSASVPMTKSSHWVTRDEPDEVNRRIDEFLEAK